MPPEPLRLPDPDPPDCLAAIAATRSLLRIALAPVMPREDANCLSSGRSMLDRPLPLFAAVVVSVTW